MRVEKNEKFLRTISFLTASHEADIRSRLSLRGFTQDDITVGWNLIYQATGAKRTFIPTVPLNTFNQDIEQLNTWENIW
ncbi:hypothetical protein KKF84_09900, partial [Myxococcota bacterium]|nr:hypothetical protein [Myxococcota bacterium]